MGIVEQLVRARADYERGDWTAALDRWSDLDADTLTAADLVSAATAAFLVGRRAVAVGHFQRAFELSEAADDLGTATYCAFHLAMMLQTGPETSLAAGWLSRAHRCSDRLPHHHVQRGYVAFAQMFAHLTTGQLTEAMACARTATEAGRRHGDSDLTALGLCSQGRLTIMTGRVADGLALLDEAMLEAATRQLNPLLLGTIYCTAIEGCQELSDLRRVAEWTQTLSRWCASQPGLVAFTGQCSLHRGQVMRAHGAWAQAIDEFSAAIDRYRRFGTVAAIGQAAAERGDLQRLCGELAAAERSYQEASEHGYDPQPGLALLWVARGAVRPALAAIRRVLAESTTPVARCRVLPGAVEVFVAAGDAGAAREAAGELRTHAEAFASESLLAQAAIASGAVELADGDPAGALPYLRKARLSCASLDMPYSAALTRMLTGRALAALGDQRSARAELEAARETFSGLGAVPDVDAVDLLLDPAALPRGLTAREVEVLRLVASGRSNAQIATELVLSDRTVARHVSNIFGKLGVTSRTAAAAFAFDHDLV